MVNELWLQLKVTKYISPYLSRASLFFEALKADIDFSLAMKVLHGISFQQKAVSSTLESVV